MLFKTNITNSIKSLKENIQSKFDCEHIKMVGIEKLKFDEDFKELFAQEPDKVERIYQDMLIRGYDNSQPIIATKDGHILDGNSRYMAALRAKINQVPVVYKEFPDKTEALKYELHLQLDRRNLNNAEILKMFRKLEELKNKTKQEGKSISEFTDSKISEQLKCSERQVQKIRELTKRADKELLQKIETGEMSINKAYVEIKKTEHPKHYETLDINNQEFRKGVKFALDEISKGKTSDEIISTLEEKTYGRN